MNGKLNNNDINRHTACLLILCNYGNNYKIAIKKNVMRSYDFVDFSILSRSF